MAISEGRLTKQDLDGLVIRANADITRIVGMDTFVDRQLLRARARAFARIEFDSVRPRGLRAMFSKAPIQEHEIEDLWLEQANVALGSNQSQLNRDREVAKIAAKRARAQGIETERLHEAQEAERRQRHLNRPAPAPAPQPYGVSHEGAERLCEAWMRHLGVLDAAVTRITSDGGIDVESAEYVAQVKNYAGSVAVADIRALLGVAVAEGKKALFFTSGEITAEGLAFADRTEIALFRYNAVEGSLAGLNRLGTSCVAHSIPDPWGTDSAGRSSSAQPQGH